MDDRTASRFWARVDKSNDCWNWTGPLDIYGYGKVQVGSKHWGAHRLAYVSVHGEPPAGLVLDHLCRNRACVNPDHLEPVTQRTNVLRSDAPPALNAVKTHCKRGHEFDAENTEVLSTGRGCRTCRRAAWRRWNEKRKAAVRGT